MNKNKLSDQFFSALEEDEIDDNWEHHVGKRNRMESSDRRSGKKIKKFNKHYVE
jgi:hypothetical protein